MDTKTLDALKASIRKWEKNVRVRNTNKAKIRSDSCVLCQLFLEKDCDGCPVKESVKARYCTKTPWGECEDASHSGTTRDFRAAARVELAFLRSLLPTSGE